MLLSDVLVDSMDTVTHTLVGIALSRLLFKKRVAYATSAMIVAANLPDLDVVYSWPGIRYLEFHRGILHSVWMLPVWGLLVALGLRWWTNKKGKRVPALWMGFALGVVGAGSHVFLDWSNAYGERLFAPFSQHWYALDWMPIFDPWVWILLAVFLVFPMLLTMIKDEVGAREKLAHRTSAALALLLLAGWIGLRARQHGVAMSTLDSTLMTEAYEGQKPTRAAVFPIDNTPFSWQAVVDLPRNYLVASVSAPWDRTQATAKPVRSFLKPPYSPEIQHASATRTAGIFLWFARFPFTSEQEEANLSMVSITDVRFAQGDILPDMRAQVTLDGSNAVVRQGFVW